ncbi:MAG TPA: TonB-dependent receptor [Bryobacteraceae bacterium]
MSLIFGAFQLFSQETGTLNGTVTNAAGAGVPQANVTVKNNGTGLSQSVITNQSGGFMVANLPPGTYTVSVEITGYRRLSQENVQVVAGQPIRLTLGMEAGSNKETVEVAGEAPMIQDQSGDISRAYSSRTISQLPLLDRNTEQFVELMPGNTPPAPAVSVLNDPQQSRTWNTNGQPAESNRRLLNGTENDELNQGVSVHSPTLDSVQQMNVITGNYDASQGRAGGTILNYITRRGTNGLHGSVFEFNANSWERARDYFNPVGFPQARYNQNEFGATLGGPIVRDHMFFFLSWESDYHREQMPGVYTVPTPDLLAGNFSNVPGVAIYNPLIGPVSGTGRSQFPGNMIPASMISPTSRALLGYFPAPNEPGYIDNLITTTPFRNDDLRLEGRIDDRFNDRTGMYLSYAYGNAYANQGSPFGVIGNSAQARLRNDHASFGFTHSLGATTTTDVKFTYNRWYNPIYSDGGILSAAAAGISYANGQPISGTLPAIRIGDLPLLGTNPNYNQTNIDQSLHLANSWSKRWRGHDLRFGVDLWGVRLDGFQNLMAGSSGAFDFTSGATSLNGGNVLGPYSGYANSFAAFLLGTPTTASVGQSYVSPSNYTAQWSGYLADTFQVTKNLTLDIGIRYDLFSPLTPRSAAGNYVYDLPSNMLLPIDQGFINNRGNVRYDTDNWAPRFGFAYRIGEKTVVRGGYGISYWNGIAAFSGNEFVNANSSLLNGIAGGYGIAGSFNQVPYPGAPISGAMVAPNNPYYFMPRNIQTPYVQSFNFMIQRDLGWATVLDLSYVGSLGRELPYVNNINAAAPGSGTTGIPFNVGSYNNLSAPLNELTSGLTSNYNALQLNITKRFSKNLAFTLAYAYSKSLDYGNGGLTPLQDSFDLRNNYGPSNFDRTNVFTLSHVWQLPFGTGTNHLGKGVLGHILGPWQIDGVFHYASGTPWTPTADSALCACSGNTVRADIVPNGTSTVFGYYPTFFGFYPYAYNVQNYALAQPQPGLYGNAGRNILRGGSLASYDMSLFRTFVFLENTRLELRAEAYNIANSSFFANPTVTNVNAGNFGESTGLLSGYGPRTLQLALRLVF